MKNKIRLGIFSVVSIFLAACSGGGVENGSSDAEANQEVVHLATSPGPYSDLFIDYVQPVLEEEGYPVEVTSFQDVNQVNESLLEGQTNVNVEQNQLFVDNYNQERGSDLTTLGPLPTLPSTLYGARKSALEEVSDGDRIAVPEDVANFTRALLILEKAEWIELDPTVEPINATEDDIVENHYNLEIIPMASPTIPRALEDVEYAVIPGAIAHDGSVDLDTALLAEDILPELMLQLLVPNGGQDAGWVPVIQEVYQSDEFKAEIERINEEEGSNWVLPD